MPESQAPEAKRSIAVPPEKRTREEQGRDNYCKMMGHHFTVGITESGDFVLMCDNHCWIDRKYKVVPIEEGE